jgi:hypothetical protein
MANFYNPYMKGPDMAQGTSDMVSQIMQMMMMKKMFGGQKPQTQQVPTPLPPQGGMAQAQGPALMQGAQAPQVDRDMMNDPMIKQMLLQAMGGIRR